MLVKIKVDISFYRDGDYIVNFNWRVYEMKKKIFFVRLKFFFLNWTEVIKKNTSY
jgi:hypothetical protein